MAVKYRITHTPDGYRIGVTYGVDSNTGKLAWVPATTKTFDSQHEAERGLAIVIAAKQWLYNELGERVDGEGNI